MRNQKGMTMIGWIGVIAVLMVIALAALRLVPVYLQYFKISSVLRDLPIRQQEEARVSPQTIKDYLTKRFDVEGINIIEPTEVEVSRDGEFYLVTAKYDHIVPYVANVKFLVEFEKEVKVAR